MATKKDELMSFFDNLKGKKNIASFTVVVTTPGCEAPEHIMNPTVNLETKQEFYRKAYTDDLVHAMNDRVKIVEWFAHVDPRGWAESEILPYREG